MRKPKLVSKNPGKKAAVPIFTLSLVILLCTNTKYAPSQPPKGCSLSGKLMLNGLFFLSNGAGRLLDEGKMLLVHVFLPSVNSSGYHFNNLNQYYTYMGFFLLNLLATQPVTQ